MGDTQNEPSIPGGIHVGDFMVRPKLALSTDGHLDTPQARERTVQAEDVAHAAQHRAPDAPDPATATAQAADDVDASIAQARAATAPDDVPIPIVLYDPLTGKAVTMGGDPPYPPAPPVTMGGDPPTPPAGAL